MTAVTYWHVPGHYGVGPDFVDRASAFTEAAAQLAKRLHENETDNRFNALRVAVDERVKDATGDRPVRRHYLMIDPAAVPLRDGAAS
jgi:hypothetical protein